MLTLDFSNMIAREGRTGDARAAIPEAAWTAAAKRFGDADAALRRQYADGVLGFLDLPGNAALAAQSTKFAADVRGRFTDVVVLGIGGSALGPIALRTALRPSGWNMLGDRHAAATPGSTCSTTSIR